MTYPLDRPGAVIGEPGQPNDRAVVSIHVVHGNLDRSLRMRATDAIDMALSILAVTGSTPRSSCPTCLAAGAIAGAATTATIILIFGG